MSGDHLLQVGGKVGGWVRGWVRSGWVRKAGPSWNEVSSKVGSPLLTPARPAHYYSMTDHTTHHTALLVTTDLHGELAARSVLAWLPARSRPAEARHVEARGALAAVARTAAGARTAPLPLASTSRDLVRLLLLLQPRPLLPLRLPRACCLLFGRPLGHLVGLGLALALGPGLELGPGLGHC